MPWDVNQMNQLFMGQVLGNSPAESFDKGRADAYNEKITRENNDAVRQAREVALLRTQQKAKDQEILARQPTPENYQAYFLRYPEDREAAKEAWNSQSAQQQKSALTTLYNLKGYLQNGKQGEAYTHLRQRIEAEKAAGMDTADDEELLAHIVENPDGAVGVINGMLSMVSDPTKAPEGLSQLATAAKTGAETSLIEQTTPAKVQEAEAAADKATTEANYAPKVIESDLASEHAARQKISAEIQNMTETRKIEWAKLGLEQDKLATTTQLALEKMYQDGAKPDPNSVGVMNASAAEAVTANALAGRMNDLARQVKVAGLSAGPAATAYEAFKKMTGSQNGYTQIRAEVTQILNKAALANRKDMPGAMSDADRQFLLQGFPPQNASPTYVAHYLEVMAKAQASIAQAEDSKTAWIGANGNLGPAKRDMNMGGYQITRGTTFSGFMKYASAKSKQKDPPPTVDTLLGKYGGGR